MESKIMLPPLGATELILLWAVLACAFIALIYGWFLVRKVIREDPGTKKMIEVAKAIEDGALAYLRRQFNTMIWFVGIITAGLFLLYRQAPNYTFSLSVGIAVAFVLGVLASYGAGYVGMWLAVKGNVRSANAALTSFKKALELAFKAGTVSGMFTPGVWTFRCYLHISDIPSGCYEGSNRFWIWWMFSCTIYAYWRRDLYQGGGCGSGSGGKS